jgi:Flp pilus assembly protein TadD/general stress protein CsbA
LQSAAAKAQEVTVRKPEGLFSSPEKRTFVLCLLLIVATLAVYNPVNRNTFVNFDDDHYITHNPNVITGLNWQTVQWALTNFYEANWHPLTWISHALDCQLFGLNPVGHHYVNVFLHALNAVLLFWLLQSATKCTWRSLMVAALFALHPVNVESVAWASERKNVLSMMFLLLAMQAYGWYARKPGVARYSAVTVLFACGLMSKPQIITLPFVLLLWDYWPLRRFESTTKRALLLEKTPLFLLSLASAIITIKAQKAGGAIHSAVLYPFGLRLQNAVVSYSRYIGKAFWPTQLSPLYPHPLDLLRFWQVIASVLWLTLVTVLVVQHRKQGYLLTGWLWFLGTLVPMIGLIQVGEQAMADRYAYLPFIGLFVMVCWALPEWIGERRISAKWLAIPAVAVLIAFSLLTIRQIGHWKNSESLWSYAINVSDGRNYKAHFNLGLAYNDQGRFDEAITQFQQAVDPRNDDPRIHLGLGIYDQNHGHVNEAVEEYQTTLRLTADRALQSDAYSNLGSAYRQTGDSAHAKESFAAALQLNPDQPMALIGAGLIEQKTGNMAQAIQDYSRAISRQPTPVGYALLGRALMQAGHASEAQSAFDRGMQLTSDWNGALQAADQLLRF